MGSIGVSAIDMASDDVEDGAEAVVAGSLENPVITKRLLTLIIANKMTAIARGIINFLYRMQ